MAYIKSLKPGHTQIEIPEPIPLDTDVEPLLRHSSQPSQRCVSGEKTFQKVSDTQWHRRLYNHWPKRLQFEDKQKPVSFPTSSQTNTQTSHKGGSLVPMKRILTKSLTEMSSLVQTPQKQTPAPSYKSMSNLPSSSFRSTHYTRPTSTVNPSLKAPSAGVPRQASTVQQPSVTKPYNLISKSNHTTTYRNLQPSVVGVKTNKKLLSFMDLTKPDSNSTQQAVCKSEVTHQCMAARERGMVTQTTRQTGMVYKSEHSLQYGRISSYEPSRTPPNLRENSVTVHPTHNLGSSRISVSKNGALLDSQTQTNVSTNLQPYGHSLAPVALRMQQAHLPASIQPVAYQQKQPTLLHGQTNTTVNMPQTNTTVNMPQTNTTFNMPQTHWSAATSICGTDIHQDNLQKFLRGVYEMKQNNPSYFPGLQIPGITDRFYFPFPSTKYVDDLEDLKDIKPYVISGWISNNYLSALKKKTNLVSEMFDNAVDNVGDIRPEIVKNCRKTTDAVFARDLVFRMFTMEELNRTKLRMSLSLIKVGAVKRCVKRQFPDTTSRTWRQKCLPLIRSSTKILFNHRVKQVLNFWKKMDEKEQ